MDRLPDGFYTTYITGKAGSGLALFAIRAGVITGADLLGAIYDGRITDEGAAGYKVTIDLKLPPNLPLIQGGTSGPHGDVDQLTFQLPENFLSEAFVRIEGKRGPVNAKFVRIRGFDD